MFYNYQHYIFMKYLRVNERSCGYLVVLDNLQFDKT